MKKSLNKLIALLTISMVIVGGTSYAGISPALSGVGNIPDFHSRQEMTPAPAMKVRGEEYIIKELTEYVWNSGNWIENMRMYRTFVDISNIETETYQGWNGSSWVNSQRQNNVYNDQDRLIQIVWMSYYMGTWNIFLNTEITYTDFGEMYQAHSFYGSNPEILESFSYDDQYRVIEYLYQTRPDPYADYENERRRTYTYTPEGGNDEIIMQNWSGSEFENDSKIKFLYDGQNRISERIESAYYAGVWNPDIRYLFTYDADNRLFETVEQTFGGSEWRDNARVFYYYNDNGTVAYEEHEVVDPVEDWIFESKRVYQYLQFTTDVADAGNPLPNEFSLGQNYPNPFNMSTVIEFTLPTRENVSLSIYNILGQKVATVLDRVLPAGNHSALWDGRDKYGKDVPSGVYFYQLRSDSENRTNKMMLVK